MKLTLVTITHNGRKHTAYLKCNTTKDGKAYLTPDQLEMLLQRYGIPRGATYILG